jgi:hypothetical protein
VAAVLLLAARATGAPVIGPPVDTRGPTTSGRALWVASCVHPYHPASYADSRASACGWVAPPGRFAFCLDYPGGVYSQLTCYSPVSGWVVNIPALTTLLGRPQPTAHRDPAVLHYSTPALVLEPRSPWSSSGSPRLAGPGDPVCSGSTHFFRCDLGRYGVWFKPDGVFLVYRRAAGAKGAPIRTVVIDTGR